MVEGEEGGGVITGLAHVFLEETFFIGTAFLYEIEVIGFIHLLARIFRPWPPCRRVAAPLK